FPIDSLKIDRSFVLGMSSDQENLEIVRAIVALAHNLGLKVTAEGVETVEQLAQLRALGCEYAQGYLFAKPLSPEAVDEQLASGEWSFAGFRAPPAEQLTLAVD
ncbi:MAG: EAL domain-containing protein, partial [bacterium]|nr:EAL domain-containing protein [bacterium]